LGYMSAAEGLEWVKRANSRPIGETEFRLVTMQIGTGPKSRSLRICTLRRTRGDRAQTVFCVMEPWPLSNVNYVVAEHKGQIEPFVIELYLPYVLGTLRTLPSARRKESLLGSDFSYDDMRTWLYEAGHLYEDPVLTDSMVRVRGRCVEGTHLVRHGTAPFEIWLDPRDATVRGINYLSPDGRSIVRRYHAGEFQTIDGIAIPGRMIMWDEVRGHSTTIQLERAWFNREIDPSVFEPTFRRHTKEYLATL